MSNVLHGKFGIIIYDQQQERFFVTRDHLGIIPVYIGRGSHGEFFVASELKAFHDFATSIEILLPGNYDYFNLILFHYNKDITTTQNYKNKLDGINHFITNQDICQTPLLI